MTTNKVIILRNMPHLNTKLSNPLKAGLPAESQAVYIFYVFMGTFSIVNILHTIFIL